MLRKERKVCSSKKSAAIAEPASPHRSPALSAMDGGSDDEDFLPTSGNALSDLLEQVQEKRASTREEALTDLRDRSMASIISGDLADIGEELLPALARSLRRGGEEEIELAADVVSLYFLSVPDVGAEQLSEVVGALRDATRNGSPSAASALALCCIVASDDIDVTIDSLDTLRGVFSGSRGNEDFSAEAISSAIDAYGFLSTGVSRDYVRDQLADSVGETLLKLLRGGELEVRIAAGELAALLVELAASRKWRKYTWRRRRGNADEEDEDDEEDDDEDEEDEDEDDEDNNDYRNDVDPGLFASLRSELESHATESDRRMARRDRTRQRAMFRDISEFFETGVYAGERTLRFQYDVVEIKRWARASLVEALTRALGVGLHVHAAGNPTVQRMLGITIDEGESQPMSSKQRGAARKARAANNAASAKERAQRMGRQRKQKGSGADL